MEKRLNFLESFFASGADGQTYKVYAYEHLVRDESVAGGTGWESTGQLEYRLADGGRVEVQRDGSMRVAHSGVELRPPERLEQDRNAVEMPGHRA